MRCRQMDKYIYKYFDGRLSKEEEHILEEHLVSCDICKGKYKETEKLTAQLNAIEGINAPFDFTESVMKAVSCLKKEENYNVIYQNLNSYRMAFRHLGISMVLTAAVLLVSHMSPESYKLKVEDLLNTSYSFYNEKSEKVSNSLFDFNIAIKGLIRDFNNTVERIEED